MGSPTAPTDIPLSRRAGVASNDRWSVPHAARHCGAAMADKLAGLRKGGPASGLGAGPVSVHVTNQVISFSAGGTSYNVNVPDSIVNFSAKC